MKKVGVIGAGVIGAGVAQDFAEHGFRVILIDLTEKNWIKPGLQYIDNLDLEGCLKQIRF